MKAPVLESLFNKIAGPQAYLSEFRLNFLVFTQILAKSVCDLKL